MIRLEILNYNYWEHFKMEKDLALILPASHPKRILIREATEKILAEIHALTKQQ